MQTIQKIAFATAFMALISACASNTPAPVELHSAARSCGSGFSVRINAASRPLYNQANMMLTRAGISPYQGSNASLEFRVSEVAGKPGLVSYELFDMGCGSQAAPRRLGYCTAYAFTTGRAEDCVALVRAKMIMQ